MAQEICRRITGGEALHHICIEDHMPAVSTIMHWRAENPEFLARYTKAREYYAEHMFAEMQEIADTPQLGSRSVFTEKDGEKIYTGDMLEHRKLRIETRKWLLPRLNKSMSEKAVLDHTSSDGSMTPSSATDKAVLARLNAIYKATAARVAAAEVAEKGVDYDASDIL